MGRRTSPTQDPHEELCHKFRGLILAVKTDLGLHTGTVSCTSSCQGFVQHEAPTIVSPPTEFTTLAKMSPKKLEQLAEQYEEMAQHDFIVGSPRIDQLLTLIQFNVFRALLKNTLTLGWNFEWLECGEPISPWNKQRRHDIVPFCPSSLRPTDLQRKIKHHPWIDLWPIPAMRDNLLLADGLYDEDQLCNDLVEFADVTNEQSGLIVWGEPWNPGAWEVSEMFVRKWAWTLKGCVNLLASTNHWRSRRGEEPLVFDV
ncbi:hypothetical protein BX600DRAFT_475754 [Xylariales sp. PMI_506]|nr:hypothetical protein BX600DRAFT_475754 [Xylariales sp. PMI_506]